MIRIGESLTRELFLLPSTGWRQRRRRGRFHGLGRHAALWWQLTGAGRGRVHVRRGGPGAGAAQGEERERRTGPVCSGGKTARAV